MKRLSKHSAWFHDDQSRKRLKKEKRKAGARKHRKKAKGGYRAVDQELLLLHAVRRRRRIIAQKLHKSFNYSSGRTRVDIRGALGVEEEALQESFLETASKCIDFNSAELNLNILEATRIWPSGVTLLCSLKEWVEYAAKTNGRPHPRIGSSRSSSSYVNAYLDHCGFYDYVGRMRDGAQVSYSEEEVVKIKREIDKRKIEPRELELYHLVKAHSEYSQEDLELFDSIVLTETFNNVVEHGIVNKDQGWWILGQYHPHHGFISICIADNGIGFRNTLMAGPQREQIRIELDRLDHRAGDGDFISMAMFANVSGAYDASTKDSGIFRKVYSKGARRGHGLQRIKEACVRLRIDLSILSHHGYLFLDSNGNVTKKGANANRIFGGTMYAYTIPARRVS